MNNSTELPALTPGPDDALTNKFCKHAVNCPPACCRWHLTVSLGREAFTGMIRSQKASDRARSPRHLVVPVYSGFVIWANMMTTLIQTVSFGEGDPANPVVHGQVDFRRFAKGTEALAAAKPAVPKIAVVDDDENIHVFVKDLGDLGHFKLVGSSYNAAQALDRLPEMRPDAVIMDLRLPDMSGIECATRLKTILPGLPIIMLTGYPDGRSFFRSLMEGAKGFLVKPVSAQEFLNAIDDVLKGEFALAKQVIPFLIQLVHQVRQVTQESRLTTREEEILACLFEGMQDKEIAAALGIGTATVHTHMHRLFEKLGVHSRTEIVAKYLELN